MFRKLVLTAAAAGAVFIVGACGGSGTSGYGSSDYGSSTSTAPQGTSPGRNPGTATAPGGGPGPSTMTTIGVRSSALGQILVDGRGRTVYLFEADKGTASTCYDACAGVWPPVVTSAAPVAGPGINQGLLATTRRKDGSLEVVYNGHPLYYFASDTQAGDTTGQGLNSFGAGWDVLSPAGTKIEG
jgi:predicted lipoprotein with Yx(FWY)xxD motif